MRRNQYLVFAFLAIVVAFASCSRPKPVVKQYSKDGIQFSYYSDWTIAKDAPSGSNQDIRAINIEGPDHAVVILICLPASSGQTLERYAAAVAEKRGAEIESKLTVGPIKAGEVSKGTSAPTTGIIAGQERVGILQTFSIDMLGATVPHEAKFFSVQGGQYKVMIISQVASKHIATTKPASELILSTLAFESSS